MYLARYAGVRGLVAGGAGNAGGNRYVRWGAPRSRKTKNQGKDDGREKEGGISGNSIFLYK